VGRDLHRVGRIVDLNTKVEVLEIRANRASELVSDTPTLSSPMSGRKSPDCKAVKAIKVPIVIVPAVMGSPALR